MIGLDAVSGAVRLAEGVARKAAHQSPHFFNLLGRMSARPGGREELAVDFLDDAALLPIQGAAQHVGAAGRQPGEGFAELQDMLLVNHQPVGAAQAGFQRRMRIGHRLQALITASEGQFLAFIGRAGPNDAHDGNQPVYFPHVAHATQACHCR